MLKYLSLPSVKGPKRANVAFYSCEKYKKISGLVIYLNLKGAPFLNNNNNRIKKLGGVPFLSKMVLLMEILPSLHERVDA